MENSSGSAAMRVFVWYFISLVAGIIFIGSDVAKPSGSLFTFSLFGFSAIIFYSLPVRRGTKIFLGGGILLSAALIILFMYTSDALIILRNFLWFVLTGSLVYRIYTIEKGKSALFMLTAWFGGFVLIYIVMVFLNIYLFGFYRMRDNVSLFIYLFQAMKIGGVLGLGLGLGKAASDILFQNNLKEAKSR